MDVFRRVIGEFDHFDTTLDADARKEETMRKIEILQSLAPDVQKQFTGRALPLEIYSFALKSMICPHFQTRLTPQILDLLAMIEFYRMFMISKITEILVLHEYFDVNEKPGVPTLLDDDKDFFNQFHDDNPTMRMLFIKIIAFCCRVDICHKWLQKSNTEFWIRWNQYFAFLEDHPKIIETPALKFQHDLKPEERKIFKSAAETCVKYMNATFASAEDLQQEGQAIRELMETSDFAEQHQLQNLDDFSDRIISYADRVSEAWNRIRIANIYDVKLDASVQDFIVE
ncbi:hypothetical protein BJ165DRAFT_1608956 [Panaeolus papilionaceus]|nr:hypothetical protein BJ165DRAFT_1608956 [Panaeolus papilionaceus]